MSEHFPLEDQWQILNKVKEDFNAFEPLYSYYYPRIYRFVYIRISDKYIAEDLTSKIFLKMTEQLPHKVWDSIEAFIKYLYMIARNTLKNHYRDHKTTSSLDIELGKEHINQDVLDLGEVLKKLDQKEKELLDLHYFLGYSFEEISALLNKRGSSVRMRHKRLLEKIRSLM